MISANSSPLEKPQQKPKKPKSYLKKLNEYTYNPRKVLGSGSYGTVYKGKSTITNKVYAIKQIDVNHFKKDIENLLQREIKINRRIFHKNIVEFVDALKTKNNIYIIAEYCEGGSLEDYLKKVPYLPEQEAMTFAKQIVNGYHYLYRNGIIHRDLKPANLLLDGNNVIKICDFGQAKQIINNASQTIVGTPNYLAPEIMVGDVRYDSKVDVWSFGVVLYEMLFGRRPWKGQNCFELWTNVKDKELTFPNEINVSDSVKEMLQKMLAVDKDKRADWNEIIQSKMFKNSDDENIFLTNIPIGNSDESDESEEIQENITGETSGSEMEIKPFES